MLQEEEAIREELEAAEEPEVYRAVLRLNSVHLIRVVSRTLVVNPPVAESKKRWLDSLLAVVSTVTALPRLHPLTDLLAARELLRRQPDKTDRRVIHLALTDAGAALAREGQKLQSTCLDALFAGLTQSEAERFQELLEKVLTSAEVRLKEGGNT